MQGVNLPSVGALTHGLFMTLGFVVHDVMLIDNMLNIIINFNLFILLCFIHINLL